MLNTEEIFSILKNFQIKPANYFFRKLDEYSDPTSRILITHEGGLRETLATYRVIVKAIEKQWGDVARIDVIYICRNHNIARKNITGKTNFSYPTRLTMLPVQMGKLADSKLNFITLTPGTSFNIKSSCGIYSERVILYYMLKIGLEYGEGEALKNIFRCNVSDKNWVDYLKHFNPELVDPDIMATFITAFRQNGELTDDLESLLNDFANDGKPVPGNAKKRQAVFIGTLRRMLAEICLYALEPDIIIVDKS